MSKMLYITLVNDGATNGGMAARKAIGKALADIVGKDNIDVITSELDHSEWAGKVIYQMRHFDKLSDKLGNLLSGNTTQIGSKDINNIIEIIQKEKYDIVAFGCSESGKLIKEVKKLDIKIITFYQDIIADAIKNKLKNKFSLSYFIVGLGEMRAESMTTKLSDRCIVLNKRDETCLVTNWKRKADAIVPICVEDHFRETEIKDKNVGEPLKLLFVGAYGWEPNVEGIMWFSNTVMKKLEDVEVCLYIAGYGTEELQESEELVNTRNIKILGTVNDLGEVYGQMDIVVSPILSGTGMKTKTAEALMHGKFILGTEEALEGFIGLDSALCRNELEFEKRIRECLVKRPPRFIKEHRKLYEDNYSVSAVRNKIRLVIENL